MRPSTDPYCLSMLEPRVMRGGTMRPENSSKVCENTFWFWSRAMTALSSVTPARLLAMTVCEMPLLTASFLKSSSQPSNVPLPQAAAKAGAAEMVSSAPSAKALREVLGFIWQNAPISTQSRHLSGVNPISVRVTAAKTRLQAAVVLTNARYPSRLVYGHPKDKPPVDKQPA